MRDIAELKRFILDEALDDWVAIGTVVDWTQTIGCTDYPSGLEWALTASLELSSAGLVRFVRLDTDGRHLFDVSPEQVADDTRGEYRLSGRNGSDFYVWLELTPRGREAGEVQ